MDEKIEDEGTKSAAQAAKELDNATLNPKPESTFSLMPRERKREWIQVSALYLCLFSVGWFEGSIGPLIPAFQNYYGVNYTIVSLLFIFKTIGTLLGTVCIVVFANRISFGKILATGAILSMIAAVLQVSQPPFPVQVLAFVISGFGIALEDACCNVFVACLQEKGALKMGILHSFYGFGGFAGPLVATQFAPVRRWTFFFFTSLGFGIAVLIINLWVFGFKTQTELIARYEDGRGSSDSTATRKSVARLVLTNKATILLCLFCFIYIGGGLSRGGWVVTFLIKQRSGGSSTGYVQSGYYGGIALGRLALLPINNLVGQYRVVFLYLVLCIGLEISVWQAHSFIGNAIAVSFIGFLGGPLYPIMISQAGKVVPRDILTGSIGLIGASGAIGSALFPFIVGVLAGKFGIIALEPVLVILLCISVILWAMVPQNVS